MSAAIYPAPGVLRHLLALVIVTLPLMDLEVFQVAGRSIVLPYVAVTLLTVVMARRPRALAGFLRVDAATSFLVGWLLIAAASGAAAFYRSQQSTVLAANGAQFANFAIMAVHYVVIGAALRLQPPLHQARLVGLFVATAAAGGLLSLYQVGSVVFGWPYVDLLRTSNLYLHNDTLTWHGGGSWISFPRALGAAPEPTFWAGYMAVGLALAIGRVVRPLRVLCVAEVALIAGGLLVTFARAAVPAVATVLVLCLWMQRHPPLPRWVGPGLVLLAFCGTLWPAFASDRWLTLFDDQSAIGRFSSTITGVQMLADYPLTGVGPGSIPFMVDQYLYVVEGRRGISFSYLHSFLATVVATTGIVGALCFGCFLVEISRRLHWLERLADQEQRRLAQSAFLAFACIVVYWIGSGAYNMSYLWFCCALAAGLPGAGVAAEA